MTKTNRTSLSSSLICKRTLPTLSSISDANDSSSCSSTSSSSFSTITQNDNNNTVTSCDLLNILANARFRPVFQAIDEIKRRKCRPDLERILKYVAKRYTTKNLSDQRNEVLSILDDLLKYGLITKVFHKGGFTIRIKNEKHLKLIENLKTCCNQDLSTDIPMNSYEPMATALTDAKRSISKQFVFDSSESSNPKRETPSPEFAVLDTSKLNDYN